MPRPGAAALKRLIDPRSVAIIGASDRGDKPGARLAAAMIASGYKGRLYGVNPRPLTMDGLQWVATDGELPEVPDLVCFATPAEGTVESFARLAVRGLKAAIVYSGGFGEAGPAGQALEAGLVRLAEQYGVALCGPNTAGLMDLSTRFVGTFTHALEAGAPPAGDVMIITQSGAVGGILLTHFRERRLGVSGWISVGNGAVLDVADYLELAADDDRTSVVALFIEGAGDGARFMAAARRCRAAGKTIVAYKAGRSALGAKAAASHTGKLAGSDAVYDGVFAQLGIVRASTLRELVDYAQSLSWLGRRPGARGAIMSVSGAGCTVLADEIAASGLQLAAFADSTAAELVRVLPGFSQKANPVDLTGKVLEELPRLTDAIRAVLADPRVDFAVLCFATNNRADIAGAVIEGWDRKKPLVVVTPVAARDSAVMDEVLADARIPVYPDLADAVAALRALPSETPLSDDDAAAADSRDSTDDSGWLTASAALATLASAGLPVVATERFSSAGEAASFAASLRGRVAVKIDHPQVLHKTDVGGVRIVDAADVAEACDAIRTAVEARGVEFAPAGGFIVQELAAEGAEVIIGLTTDPTFGRTLTIGVGGTLVEAVGQTASRVLPLAAADVRSAIAATTLGGLLAADRRGARDQAALEELVLAFQALAEADASVDEAELNPVIVYAAGEGAKIVDARIHRP